MLLTFHAYVIILYISIFIIVNRIQECDEWCVLTIILKGVTGYEKVCM